MKVRYSPKPISTRRANRHRGFILPVAMLLISILMILGWMFLSTTMHSKNISSVFYRDDLARLVAESAATEFRTIFRTARQERGSAVPLRQPGRHRQLDDPEPE